MKRLRLLGISAAIGCLAVLGSASAQADDGLDLGADVFAPSALVAKSPELGLSVPLVWSWRP